MFNLFSYKSIDFYLVIILRKIIYIDLGKKIVLLYLLNVFVIFKLNML